MYERKLHLLSGMMLDKLEENGLMGFETILGKINFQKEGKKHFGEKWALFSNWSKIFGVQRADLGRKAITEKI